MDREQIATQLRAKYESLGIACSLTGEAAVLSVNGCDVLVNLDETCRYEDELQHGNRRIQETACGLVGHGYREQLVIEVSRRHIPLRGRDRDQLALKDAAGQAIGHFGPPTGMFIHVHQFKPYIVDIIKRRTRMLSYRKERQSLSEILSGVRTVSLDVSSGHDNGPAARPTEVRLQSVLFDIAYTSGAVFNLCADWPIDRRRLRSPSFLRPQAGDEVSLRNAQYQTDAVRFYALARSLPSAMLAFLSYYHVFEFFFLPVSEDKLNQRLIRLLRDPKFTLRHDQMSRISKEVLVISLFLHPKDSLHLCAGVQHGCDKQRNAATHLRRTPTN
ncbi:MAG: hypothetical protein KF912_01280 [Phycisphaeraceae bacterium]|nr:hypothetical protein [Phycisphaeraceae bacterium]